MRRRALDCLIAGAALGSWTYLALRHKHQCWGATDEEAARELPGDELLAHPQLEVTRAVTIEAPRSGVWPWLVQMGTGRAGYYSYDAIDNKGRPSAEEILPHLQEISVGQMLAAEGEEGFKVAALEPNRNLVLSAMGESWSGIENDTSLSYVLVEERPGRTRLLCRMRVGYAPGALSSLLVPWLVEPGDFVMMRRQLLGIKRRASSATTGA